MGYQKIIRAMETSTYMVWTTLGSQLEGTTSLRFSCGSASAAHPKTRTEANACIIPERKRRREKMNEKNGGTG
jgi:hypothetical protein